MAKTTSQIIAENKAKRAEEAKIAASRDAIHQRQMAELEETTVQPKEITFYDSPLFFGVSGFLLGVLVMFVFFKIKIQKIKRDCDIRINEARSALDRMLKIASKEQ